MVVPSTFLGIDFSFVENTPVSAVYTEVSEDISELSGFFDAYNMRIHVGGSGRIVSEVYNACRDADLDNICFLSYVLHESLNVSDKPDKPDETTVTETEPEKDNSNPYIVVPETEPETEDNTYTPADGKTPWY